MIAYNRINNITGWVVFFIALISYTMTMEASASWWDCGEFIAAAYKLQVVHPPGAPIFLMMGKIFTLFASSPEQVSVMMNFFSALSTAFAVLFCFWIATRLAKKLLIGDGEITKANTAAVMFTGIVAGLTCAYMDSWWFSAVEAEVYALATFFFAMTFWAMIKWEEKADTPEGDRWILFIFLMIGLSMGVHLLSLLTIPAMGLIYYFRNYKYSAKGFWAAMGISFVILGIILFGVIDKFIAIAAWFDRTFVNGFSLPFNSGTFFFCVLLVGGTIYLVRYAALRGKRVIYIASMSFLMLIIGWSSNAMVLIRAKAEPVINMNGINDVHSFLSYLRREQYGSRDLGYGPYWTARPLDIEYTGDKWGKIPGGEEYVSVGKDFKIIYDLPDDQLRAAGLTPAQIDLMKKRNKQTLFPRMGSLESRHASLYYNFVGVPEGQESTYVPDGLDNFQFFREYQIGYMFWRYFMWNFSGRQNDSQGYFHDGMKDGNWITGIEALDKTKNEHLQNLPPSMKDVMSRNTFFMIPFILGLLGMVIHLRKDWKGFLILFMFFFFMGFMNLFNSNEPPIEPRERDYALVGAFFVYAIWVGFGVLALFDIAKKKDTKTITEYLLYAGIIMVIMFLIGLTVYDFGSFIAYLIYAAAIIGILSFIVIAAGRALKSDYAVAVLIGLLCLSAPVLMAQQGWDDHNRHNRTMARDFARNYLESCPPNAILFTQGDNDTYPLWYAQEVEGIRTDVRIINLSLLGVDWYINQLRHAANDAGNIDLLLGYEKILGDKRNSIRFDTKSKFQNRVVDLKEAVLFMGNDNPEAMSQSTGENYIPSLKFKVAVDSATAAQNNLVPDNLKGNIVSEMPFDLKNKSLLKNDLMVLDIVASNISKRPICFAITVSPDAYLGLEKYFMQRSMVWQIAPVMINGNGFNRAINQEVMFDQLVTNNIFTYGGIETGEKLNLESSSLGSAMTAKYVNYQALAGDYMEEALNAEAQAKQMLAQDSSNTELKEVGNQLMEESAEKKQKAAQVLDMMMKKFPESSMPYDYNMINTANYYQLIGNNERALEVINILGSRCLQDLEYFYHINNEGAMTSVIDSDKGDAERCMNNVIAIAKKIGDTTLADNYQKQWDMLRSTYNVRPQPTQQNVPQPR
ncbi:MAG: DUF2723 domain-containing protein [Fimbriimonadaceae bacterium]|nr:DUF2723 domain-containing protein [Chitinophagales bacterium]